VREVGQEVKVENMGVKERWKGIDYLSGISYRRYKGRTKMQYGPGVP
jgi:hypothetical protein